jgi:hypothetical protein
MQPAGELATTAIVDRTGCTAEGDHIRADTGDSRVRPMSTSGGGDFGRRRTGR